MAEGGDDDALGYTIISGTVKESQIMMMGYESMPLVSLEEAVESLVSIVPRVRSYAYAAKRRCKPVPDDGLTRDGSAAIILHSMVWEPRKECLQFALSLTLRSEDKQKVKPWFLYLKLMLTALSRLPSTRRTVYRGIKKDLSKEFPEGKVFMWRGLCFCTSSIEVLEKEEFLGKTGSRTIFEIDCDSGKDIRHHSYYEPEQEILLLPARQFKVMACSHTTSKLHTIQLKEILASMTEATTPSKTDKITKTKTDTFLHNQNQTTSALYNACRNNNISLVEHYLRTISVEEINQIEPNGSTALHVAAHRGHDKIVELLLEKDVSCTTKNKYNLTPLDEAKTKKIKQMISRRMNKTRFVSESIEWIISIGNADFQAHEYSKKLEVYGKDPQFDRLIMYIKQNYLEKHLQNIEDIDTIIRYFDESIKKKDPVYLLEAYTAETGFYSALNLHLAQLQLENLTADENLSSAYYIGIIAYHPKFETLSYTGNVFRGMMITNNDLKQYKIGTRILTKTFSSSSKQLSVALRFLRNNRDAGARLSAICIYQIRNQRTALDIEHISVYPEEEEVLILPYSAFKIMDIKQNKDKTPRVEIQLSECEPWV